MREIDKYLENWVHIGDSDSDTWMKIRGRYGRKNYRVCRIDYKHESDGSNHYTIRASGDGLQINSEPLDRMPSIDRISKICNLIQLW